MHPTFGGYGGEGQSGKIGTLQVRNANRERVLLVGTRGVLWVGGKRRGWKIPINSFFYGESGNAKEREEAWRHRD